jgi:membrane protease YdiL (CAAX protease family)
VIVEALRWLAPPIAAAAAAALFDRRLERAAGAGAAPPPGLARPGRRLAAGALLAGLFYLTLFAPLSLPAEAVTPADLSAVPPARLFLLHAVLVIGLAVWLLLAYGGRPAPGEPAAREDSPPAERPPPADPLAFLGLRARRPEVEIGIGVFAGFAIWAAALGLAGLVLWGLAAAGAEDLVPTGAPRLIVFVASQPVWLRLAISLSAGLVEELFFRGFLQPRLGVWLTTALFVLAHAAYGAPAMFVTVAFLSLAYGWLARRRGSVWAAAAAHALFDAVQLLVVLPAALREMEGQP